MSSRSVSLGELDERVVGAAVGAEGEPPARLADQVDGESGDVVRHLAEAEPERPELQLVGDVVLAQVEGRLDQTPR